MSKIVYRGKTYNSVLEMPNDIRVAFQTEKRQRLAEMPDVVRKFYEHAPENVENKSAPSSDEGGYRSSPLPPPPSHPVIEPDQSTRRLALSLFVVVLLAGIAFFVMQYVN